MMAEDAVHCRLLHLAINNKTHLESKHYSRDQKLNVIDDDFDAEDGDDGDDDDGDNDENDDGGDDCMCA